MKINLIKTIVLILGFIAIASIQNVFAAQFKVVGYETSWDGTVSGIQFSKVTHVDYAFLVPNTDGSLQAIDNASKLQSLVAAGHAAGVKVSISCQTSAANWDSMASNSTNRAAFINNLMNFVNQYNLDGVDIDWEFPTGGNAPNDYATLMSQLSPTLHSQGKLLTAAVASWGGEADGVLSSVFNVVDWLNIMDYDNTNGVDQSTYASVTTSLNYWSQRGLSLSKTVMGVPFYGDPNGTYSFAQLIAMGASPNADTWNGYGYNGIPTIQQKTTLCLQDNLAGMMIWELGNDATGANSLLSAMYSIIAANGGQSSATRLVPGSIISLKALANNNYVSAENFGANPLIADRTVAGQWESFKVVDAGNGNIGLLALANNKYVCADNAGANPLIANRTSVGQWESFKVVDAGSGNIGLLALANNKYVSADNAGASPLIANRTAVSQWESFTVCIMPNNGSTYHLVCKNSGKALDNGGSTADGGQVNQWADQSVNSNQEWKLVDVGGGYFNLVCQTSGKALDNSGSTSDGTIMKQWTVMSGNQNQQWQFSSVGGGYYNVVCHVGGKTLDNGGSGSNGTAVKQWTVMSGNTNQQWRLEFIR